MQTQTIKVGYYNKWTYKYKYNYEYKAKQFFIIIIITSTSDLQPSTAIANQLPSQ